MRRFKIIGLILAGLLAITPAAFAHGGGGGGGGGHGGGFGGGGGGGHGGGFGGGFHGGGGGGFHGGGFGGGFHGGGGHFGGGNYGWHGASYGGHWNGGHRHGGRYWYGDYPNYGYGWGYPYGFGYYDDNDYYNSDLYPYVDDQTSDVVTAPSNSTVVAVQQKLAQLGYYRGQIDGLAGPETQKAIRWFQSRDKIPVTGQIDDRTLKALQIG